MRSVTNCMSTWCGRTDVCSVWGAQLIDVASCER